MLRRLAYARVSTHQKTGFPGTFCQPIRPTAIPALTDSDPDAGTPGKSANNNIAAPGGSQQACSHCYAYCQTITILDKYDWDVDLGGGMSPSECVDAAEAKCGGAYNSLMTGAHCQN